MRRFQKLSLWIAALMASCTLFSACDFFAPVSTDSFSSVEESSSESSTPEITDPETPPPATDPEESIIPLPDPEMQAIVDALYQLSAGESLPNASYTLTGVVTATGKSGKKDTVTFTVVGREDKPIYCYDIQGDEVYAVQVGDVITVSGTLKNYKNEYFEFDSGCTLDKLIPANGTTNDGSDNENDGTSGGSGSGSDFIQPTNPATSNAEARERTANYQVSGTTTVPDQAPVVATNRPKDGTKYIRNSEIEAGYSDNKNAYTVVDVNGNPAFTVFKDGGYIGIEEVAAYVFAFGTYPKNYTTSKSTSPTKSGWGKYLRLNHTSFSGDTDSYPYEPVLPNISGCGGTLHYYEMDIGTTGTDCDPKYDSALYNNGSTITRGAARIVYGKNDLNGNGIYEYGELHVFYTYNHYNDFQEYLNYQGGWGEMFGNITGGGKISSKTDYNPTPYVSVTFSPLPLLATVEIQPNDYKALLKAYI